MFRDVFADARRGPSGNRLDIVREPVVAVLRMELRHGQEMSAEVLRQIPPHELLLPLSEWLVDVGDLAPERLRVFGGDGTHDLRARARQLVNLADVRGWALQDGRYDLRHVPGVD